MQPRETRYLVTFHTTTSAIAFERSCREADLPGKLIPVPRLISASCGMCWSAPPEAKDAIRALLDRKKLDIAGEYMWN